MKVLFAVSNESISNSIIKKYSQIYKEIISSKNVYYFNAILKELQKDKSYDRIVISEDLEPFTNNNFDTIDNFLFDKLDSISDEAVNASGDDIPIILIATDRRGKTDSILVKLFGIGIYSTLIGQDRSIEGVCKLINKPRTKKEAKIYYQVDSGEVDYKPENENTVSEVELQNIINHYKKLGKNEDKYVESFDNIASQYTDAQLKIIVKCLPLNVKAVLEANSPKYQQLMSYNSNGKNGYKEQRISGVKEDKSGIKIESILENAGTKKMTKPVIIPGTVSTRSVKKIDKEASVKVEDEDKNEIIKQLDEIPQKVEEKIQALEQNKEKDLEPEVEPIVEQKRGRGRPKKVQEEKKDIVIEDKENKKRRGRPKKVNPSEENQKDDNELGVNLFDLDNEEDDDNDDTMLPGFEELDFDTDKEDKEDKKMVLPGLDDDEEENDEEEDNEVSENIDIETLSQNEVDNENDNEDNDEDDDKIKNILNRGNVQNSKSESSINANVNNNAQQQKRSLYDELIPNPVNPFAQTTDELISKDRKLVAFVGTSKNGTSFLVNNLAEFFSSQGIRTAILDLTKNKNSYYIYTKNEEELRKISFESIGKLVNGKAEGIRVNKSLDVYTCLPGEENYAGKSEEIVKTLLSNYSLVLLDCDFDSEYEYLAKAQEIYLVQSMDILTIQPLTAYLRNLKAKNILTEGKLRVVINKDLKVRGVTEKAIIGGMSCYNDPAMSFMTELFNRDTIRYTIMPFDIAAYSKYLEGLVNCIITLNGYSKEFMVALKKLASMVYPMINGKDKFNNYNRY